jgi:IS5 family transposase
LRQQRKREADFQAIGPTKGGRNSKIHAVVDAFCRPWAFILTPGNTADCVMAQDCVSLIPGVKQLLADKGYDSDAIRAFLKKRGIKPVIPGKANRKKKIRHDKKAYKGRRRALLLQAERFPADRDPIRQTRAKLLFRLVLRRYIGLLDMT